MVKCGADEWNVGNHLLVQKKTWMRDEIQKSCMKSYSQKNDFNNKFAARNWVKAHQLFANSKLPALANSLRKLPAKARMTLNGNSPMRWTFGCIFANETTPDQQQHCGWSWICVDTWHDMIWLCYAHLCGPASPSCMLRYPDTISRVRAVLRRNSGKSRWFRKASCLKPKVTDRTVEIRSPKILMIWRWSFPVGKAYFQGRNLLVLRSFFVPIPPTKKQATGHESCKLC